MSVAVALYMLAQPEAPQPQGPLRGFAHAAGGWVVRPVGLSVQSGRLGRRRIGCLHEEPSCATSFRTGPLSRLSLEP